MCLSRLRNPLAQQHRVNRHRPVMGVSNSSTSAVQPTDQTVQQQHHPLWQRVLEVYDTAQETGAATKTDTQVELCESGGINFVLRVASALKSKPKGLSGSR